LGTREAGIWGREETGKIESETAPRFAFFPFRVENKKEWEMFKIVNEVFNPFGGQLK